MGRQLKRVALDFAWPLRKVWEGFLNPHYEFSRDCPTCDGSGRSAAGLRYNAEWYGYVDFDPRSTGSVPFSVSHPVIFDHAIRNGGGCEERRRLAELFNRRWSHHLAQEDVDALMAGNRLNDLAKHLGRTPWPSEVNEWSLSGIGHDSINNWLCVKARCERNGEPLDCAICHGEGRLWDTPEDKARAEAWEPTEPPAGEGYQMWQTVSEGSPISPVCHSPEGLARWLADDDGTGDEGNATWLRMIQRGGWAPSGVSTPETGFLTGVEFMGRPIE
jgi:hypothetical protein